MIVSANQRMALHFMKDRLNLQASDDFRGVLFVHEDHRGKPMEMDHVGVAYGWHGFIGRTCFINIVVQDKRVLTRRVVREAFRFPFEECRVNVVLALVDSVNKESIELCRRAGFVWNHTVVDGGLEGDLLFWQMRKDSCRWLKEKANG